MLNLATDTLVRDRQRRLLDDATRHELRRQLHRTTPLRARAGALLIRAGTRLSRVGSRRSARPSTRAPAVLR